MRLKEDKVSFIDEAQYRGKSTPSHYSVSYGPVLKRTIVTRISASNDKPGEKIKHHIDTNPAPGQYKVDESFQASQLPKPTFLISKTKYLMLADQVSKSKKYIPGVGFYNTEKAFAKTTRGLSRGWK